MRDDIDIVSGGAELLDPARALREKLLVHHGGATDHFAAEFTADQIAAGIANTQDELIRCGQRGDLRIDLVRSRESGAWIGYCMSKLEADKTGEVFSIFVDDAYRSCGIGRVLMDKALEWLENRHAKSIVVQVLAENERAVRFYHELGFRPRKIVLKLVRRRAAGPNHP